MRSAKTTRNGTPWRGDAAWIWVALVEFAVLATLCAVLITFSAGAGFWPWLIMAGAIAVGWLAAVVVLIPRSAPDRTRSN